MTRFLKSRNASEIEVSGEDLKGDNTPFASLGCVFILYQFFQLIKTKRFDEFLFQFNK